MAGIARIGDQVQGFCTLHGKRHPLPVVGQITTCSAVALADSIGIARLNDVAIASCPQHGSIQGNIVTSSTVAKADSLGIARIGDQVQGPFTGQITTGSSIVNAE